MSGILTAASVRIASAGGGSPSMLFDSFSASGEGQWTFGSGGTNGVLGNQAGQRAFTVSTATTVTKISAYVIGSGGTLTGRTLNCAIYGVSGNNLGTLVQQSSVVAAGPTYASKTLVDFTFAGASLVSGTNYHIVFFSVQDSNGGGFNIYMNTAGLINGQLDLFDGSGVSQYPSTFPGYDLQLQVWGTQP